MNQRVIFRCSTGPRGRVSTQCLLEELPLQMLGFIANVTDILRGAVADENHVTRTVTITTAAAMDLFFKVYAAGGETELCMLLVNLHAKTTLCYFHGKKGVGFDALYRMAHVLPSTTLYVGERRRKDSSASGEGWGSESAATPVGNQSSMGSRGGKTGPTAPAAGGGRGATATSTDGTVTGSGDNSSETAVVAAATNAVPTGAAAPEYGPFVFLTYKETLRKVMALCWSLTHEVSVPLSTYKKYDGEGAVNASVAAAAAAASTVPSTGTSETSQQEQEQSNPAETQQQQQKNGGGGNDEEEQQLRLVGIWARNSVAWRLTDFACNAGKFVSVPLYDTLGPDALLHILNVTQMQVLCVEGPKVATVLQLIDQHHLPIRSVIAFEPVPAKARTAYSNAGVTLYYIGELVEKGLDKEQQRPALVGDDICTIIFTSGTTGVPKGVMQSNRSFVSLIAGYLACNNRLQLTGSDVTLSYLPLSHIYQRGVEYVLTYAGARIGYYSGEVSRLLEDIQQLKPTLFFGVPRVFTRMLDRVMQGIQQKGTLTQYLVRKALAWKEAAYKKDGERVTALVPDLVFSKIRTTFGGCLRTMCMGSAPMESQALISLQLFLAAPVCEGWGMTETGIGFLQDLADNEKGTIGGPLPSMEFKIVSVPELNYLITDTPPRGELYVRGPSVMKRYFRNPTGSREALDEDGWLRTGDVVELQHTGAVRIIDRAKNIFKLSQGEYIAPERLENIYVGSPFVEQIYLHGYSFQNALVSVVVPAKDAVEAWAAKQRKSNVPYATLLEDIDLRRKVLQSIVSAAGNRVYGFELPKNIYLVETPFSVENGLLTPTSKTIRKQVERKYKDKIDALYEELSANNGKL